MPNLMFDSETNDFAIQNLLEKEGPQFVAESERRKAAPFVVDRLGREDEESVSHQFIAENADHDAEQEVDLAQALNNASNSETNGASPIDEANQIEAAIEAARAEAEAQAAAEAAAEAAQLAAEQAAQAAAMAAVAEENIVEQEEVELITAQEPTPDLSNEAVTS
jgi:hypothetical protein